MCVSSTVQEEQPSFSYEVIIVNDGSKDGTTEVRRQSKSTNVKE